MLFSFNLNFFPTNPYTNFANKGIGIQKFLFRSRALKNRKSLAIIGF